MSQSINSFEISIEQSVIEDLHRRLDTTRWPDEETVDDWGQGAPLTHVRALCNYWRNQYDWQRCEDRLNQLGQHTTEIDGLSIHFLHIRSSHPDAMPLLLTHGWPGSVIEFLKVIEPLTEPEKHGGDAKDAFHLVIPSLPGFGFSEKPDATGWNVERIADAWITLMQRLGYEQYIAQGGDWGSAVTTAIGAKEPAGCIGIHLNLAIGMPDEQDLAQLTEQEAAMLGEMEVMQKTGTAYAQLQATKPQTIGYALTDSPVGQAAWIYEKFHGWTDNAGAPESVLGFDEMLDNIMLYWLTGTAASSARLYWESLNAFQPRPIHVPAGISQFPREIYKTSRRWAEKIFRDLIYWNEPPKGGHFAAFEQPDIFADEMRAFLRAVRK